MPQVYQGDEPMLSGADQTTDLTSLTTGDSAQHIDPDTPDSHGHEGKRSLFGKLKDKTKNVGSKLKSKVGMKKPGDPAVAGTGAHDEEEYEYEDEEEPAKDLPSSFGTAPAPLSTSHYSAPSSTPQYSSPISTSQDTAPLSAPRAFGTFDSQPKSDTLGSVGATPTPYPAAPSTGLGGSQPTSQFRSDGPASVIQAVPTQYRDYANDGLTSDSFYPSAVSKDIASGGLYDSGAKKVQESDALIPEGIMKPSDFDSTPATVPGTTSKDLEPIIPFTETKTKNYTPDTTTTADKESDLKSSVPDNLTGPFNPESTAESRGYEPETPAQSVETPDYTPETTSETKDFTPSSTRGDTPSYTEKASQGATAMKDTLYGGAAAAAGAVGYGMSRGPKDESVVDSTQSTPGKTWSDWASEKTQQAKDTVGSAVPTTTPQNTTAGDYAAGAQEKTAEVGQTAYDGAVDTKNSVVNPGKTWSDWAAEKTQQAKATVGSAVPGTTSQNPSLGDYATGAQGKTEEVGQRAYDGAVDTKNSVVNPGKTWSDWAAEKTQQAKATVGSAVPGTTSQNPSLGDYATGAQGKTEEVGQRAYDGAVDTKNSVVNPGKTWSDWAAEKTQVAKDTVGSALPSTTSQSPSAGDYAAGAQGKTEEVGQRAYDGAVGTKNTVQDKAIEGVDSMSGSRSGPNVPGSATEAGYAARDTVRSKAADLNNATNDSETYTQKAANTAYAAKDAVAFTLGLNKPSEGPTMVDQTKGYLASAVDTTKGYTQAAVDTTKNYVNQATGAGTGYTNIAKDTTGDYAGTAADTAKDYTNVSKDVTAANTAAAVATAKDYAGSGANKSKDTSATAVDTTKDYTGSAVDTTKNYTGSAVDTTKDYAGSAVDTTKGYTGAAVDTSKDYAARAYDTTAQYAQKAVDATKGYTQSATDTSKGYTQTAADQAAVAKDTAVDTLTPKEHDKALSDQVTETISNLPGQIKDTVASYTAPVAHDDTHKQEGIVGRLTGLFGFGKHPSAHPESTTPTTPTAEKTFDAVAVPTSETALPTLEEKQ